MDWQKYTTCFYLATWRVSEVRVSYSFRYIYFQWLSAALHFCWGMCLFEPWNKGTWFVWIMWRETNTVHNTCTDWCNRSSLMKWESYMKRSGRINSIQSMQPTHWEMRCFCQLLQGSRESTWPMGGSGFWDGCHVAMLLHVDFWGTQDVCLCIWDDGWIVWWHFYQILILFLFHALCCVVLLDVRVE